MSLPRRMFFASYTGQDNGESGNIPADFHGANRCLERPWTPCGGPDLPHRQAALALFTCSRAKPALDA